jgi:predicted nucleic acid-binding protein
MRCMSAEPFSLDTNILVYAYDTGAAEKHTLAKEILIRSARLPCRLTLQAMSEFFAATTRKGLLTPVTASGQIENWLSLFPTLAPSASAVRSALAHVLSGRASYWDGLLIETAAEGECTVLITEDLADGARFGRLQLVHPFGSGGLSDKTLKLLA